MVQPIRCLGGAVGETFFSRITQSAIIDLRFILCRSLVDIISDYSITHNLLSIVIDYWMRGQTCELRTSGSIPAYFIMLRPLTYTFISVAPIRLGLSYL